MRIFYISAALLLCLFSVIMYIKYQHLERSLEDGKEVIIATQHEQNKGLHKNTQELKNAKRELGKIRIELDKTQEDLSSAIQEIERLHDEIPEEFEASSDPNLLSKKIPAAYTPGLGTIKRQGTRPILFYGKEDVDPQGKKTILYNSYLEYQHGDPCDPSCITDLYVHRKEGVFPIQNPQLFVDTQIVCDGVKAPIKWIEHEKIEKGFLFISSLKGSVENSFISPNNLITEEWPESLMEDDIPLPVGYDLKEAILYRYQESDAYIIEVNALGWFISDDPGKFGPTRRIIWQGVYFADESGIKLLTPESYKDHIRLGGNFQFMGLEDINGDDKADIIIGKPVSLILEKYGKGFRSWGFGVVPLSGC